MTTREMRKEINSSKRRSKANKSTVITTFTMTPCLTRSCYSVLNFLAQAKLVVILISFLLITERWISLILFILTVSSCTTTKQIS